MFADIRHTICCVLHILDNVTGHPDKEKICEKSARESATGLETMCIQIHGGLSRLSADSGFISGPFKEFLQTNLITLSKRLVRRQNKIGITERKNPTDNRYWKDYSATRADALTQCCWQKQPFFRIFSVKTESCRNLNW